MWADAYPPETESDLAPGKQRIAKVKQWMTEALYGFAPDAPQYMRENKTAVDKIRKYRVCFKPRDWLIDRGFSYLLVRPVGARPLLLGYWRRIWVLN